MTRIASASCALVLVAITGLADSSHAACISPAGVAGQFVYDSSQSTYEVCDGNAWNSMSAAAASGACTGAGLINYGTTPRFCNGSLYVSMGGTETGATCSAAAGTFQYNATLGYMQWCDGTNLKAMRSAAVGIAYVQQAKVVANASATSFTTGSFGGSGNVTTGNGLVCSLTYIGSTLSLTSVTATGSQALTRANGPYTLGGGASAYRTEIWYVTNITGSTGTKVTAVLSGSTNLMAISCNEYSGLAKTNGLDQVAMNTTTGATVTVGPKTTTTAKELLFVTGENDNDTPTAGSGYTIRGTEAYGVIVEDRTVTALGSYSGSVGSNSASATTSIMFATFRGQ